MKSENNYIGIQSILRPQNIEEILKDFIKVSLIVLSDYNAIDVEVYKKINSNYILLGSIKRYFLNNLRRKYVVLKCQC